jgi:hypothetical protein
MNTTEKSQATKTTQPEKKVVYAARAHTTGLRDVRRIATVRWSRKLEVEQNV